MRHWLVMTLFLATMMGVLASPAAEPVKIVPAGAHDTMDFRAGEALVARYHLGPENSSVAKPFI